MRHTLDKLAQLIPSDQINIPKTDLATENGRIAEILSIVFAVGSAIALLMIAISALRIVLSRGNADDVHKSRDAIIYASIGLIITALGFVIVTFVVERI